MTGLLGLAASLLAADLLAGTYFTAEIKSFDQEEPPYLQLRMYPLEPASHWQQDFDTNRSGNIMIHEESYDKSAESRRFLFTATLADYFSADELSKQLEVAALQLLLYLYSENQSEEISNYSNQYTYPMLEAANALNRDLQARLKQAEQGIIAAEASVMELKGKSEVLNRKMQHLERLNKSQADFINTAINIDSEAKYNANKKRKINLITAESFFQVVDDKETIDSYQSKIAVLKCQIEKLNNHIQQTSNENAEIIAQNSKINDQLEKTKIALKESEQQKIKLTETLAELANTNEQWVKEKEQLTQIVREQQDRIKGLERDLADEKDNTNQKHGTTHPIAPINESSLSVELAATGSPPAGLSSTHNKQQRGILTNGSSPVSPVVTPTTRSTSTAPTQTTASTSPTINQLNANASLPTVSTNSTNPVIAVQQDASRSAMQPEQRQNVIYKQTADPEQKAYLPPVYLSTPPLSVGKLAEWQAQLSSKDALLASERQHNHTLMNDNARLHMELAAAEAALQVARTALENKRYSENYINQHQARQTPAMSSDTAMTGDAMDSGAVIYGSVLNDPTALPFAALSQQTAATAQHRLWASETRHLQALPVVFTTLPPKVQKIITLPWWLVGLQGIIALLMLSYWLSLATNSRRSVADKRA